MTAHPDLAEADDRPASLFHLPIRTVHGALTTLEPYQGQVLLIVNVASKCGFTPQYSALEALYRRRRQEGFSVLAFPCNQFGFQEPGSDREIRRFCESEYEVTFPIFSKIEVNGPGAHPLYRFLKSRQPGMLGTTAIKWNFTKFLIGRDGQVLERYAPIIRPEEIEPDLARPLAADFPRQAFATTRSR